MNLILGISGSISAYKSVDIMRLFQKNGHGVSVVLTANACRFIAPLTFETFAPGRVFSDLFAPGQDPLLHLSLARDHDLLLVAPASANVIAKMAAGIADDLLSTLAVAFAKKVVLAPAMNTAMYASAAVSENLQRLARRGVAVIEPAEGSLACAATGKGRLPAAEAIYEFCLGVLHV